MMFIEYVFFMYSRKDTYTHTYKSKREREAINVCKNVRCTYVYMSIRINE